MDIRFESEFGKKLYLEVSALADVSRIRRKYISDKYIWKLWQKVYKSNCGCTRYFVLPERWS